MQRLIFEYSPLFIAICLGLGIGYAFLLYSAKATWGKTINRILFAARAVVVFFISFLLIGPILKLTENIVEKPTLVLLVDNSTSVKESLPEQKITSLQQEIVNAKTSLEGSGFDVKLKNLQNEDVSTFTWNSPASDINGAMRNIIADYESKNLAGIMLVSDGIYNSGSSPLYNQSRIPVYTVGTGDTTQRTDLILKNLAYNKIAYQGNKFPLRAEVLVQGLQNQTVNVTITKGGKRISMMSKSAAGSPLLEFDFLIDATEKGTQRLDVAVEVLQGESNKKNNYATAFIDVVEGKKKILFIAPAPHPDIKALRSVIEKNPNYEFVLHIPGLTNVDPSLLQPGKAELIVFYDVLDVEGRTRNLYDQLSKSTSSLLVILGTKTNLRQLSASGIPINFENAGQRDAVTPVVNTSFRNFNFLENTAGVFSRFPPVDVPFGKFSYPSNATVLLYQRIGSVSTDRPLLLNWEDGNKKVAALLGPGIWRWRLNEFADRESTDFFDDVFSKLIQYLSTRDDKRKFRSFAIQNEFAEGTQAIIESQVYNDLFELLYGNSINLQLHDEQGKVTQYNYITSPGNSRYRIGDLKEGVYQFSASTSLNGKTEVVQGQFIVRTQNIESQNLTADHGLLRKMAVNSGGKFFRDNEWQKLVNDFSKAEATSIIHSEDSFNPLISLKLVFFLILLLISGEWFSRKYFGSY